MYFGVLKKNLLISLLCVSCGTTIQNNKNEVVISKDLLSQLNPTSEPKKSQNAQSLLPSEEPPKSSPSSIVNPPTDNTSPTAGSGNHQPISTAIPNPVGAHPTPVPTGTQGALVGTVFNADTGLPEAGVIIRINGASAITDTEGSYTLTALPAEIVSLSATKAGFVAFTTNVEVNANQTTQVDPILLKKSHWSLQASGTGKHLNDVQFVSSSTGFIAGDGGVLLKTSNKGANWIQSNNVPTYDYESLDFIDNNTGWAVGGVCLGSCGSGKVLKTTDGGLNWQEIASVSAANGKCDKIQFVSATTGYLSCGYLYKSTDGGQNWSKLNASPPLWSVSFWRFYDAQTGIAGQHLTTNGGAGFQPNSAIPLLNKVTYLNANKLVGFRSGKQAVSDDGGLNWTETALPANAPSVSAFHFLDTQKGWIAGSNKVYLTQNAGQTWAQQNIAYTGSVSPNAMAFFDQEHGWIVGNNGLILRY